jgi:dynein heavy chain
MENQDSMMLELDQLEETLNLLNGMNLAKDSQIKQSKKLFDDFANLKKLAKDVKKEINPLVIQETGKNNNNITKLEEDLKAYFQEMKKRDFYKYECGKEMAVEKLSGVFSEIAEFETKISDFGYVAVKFGNPNLIDNACKQVESIKLEVNNMKTLWEHISHCQVTFENNLTTSWDNTNCDDMDDATKKLQKTLKEMKVDKRCNAYAGLFEEIKRWLNFIPLISELRDPAMRERHWDSIRAKVGVDFKVDAKLMLRDVYNLNLNKYQEDVEEITDQAKQEAKMEKTLAKLNETWKDVKFMYTIHKGSDVQMFNLKEEDFEMLEEN